MKNCYRFFILFLACTIGFYSFGQDPPYSTDGSEYSPRNIQTAVPFLRISPEARSGAMGDVGLAISPDANSVFWNSAKLPFAEENGGISLAYTPWLANLDVNDLHLINAAWYTKLDDDQAISAAVKYFSLGETEFRNTANDPSYKENPQEFAIQGGYSRKLSEVSGIGVNLKYIHSDLARNQGAANAKVGSAVAGDVNYYFDPLAGETADWAFAASLSNLGSKISYIEDASENEKDFLPTNFGIGTNVNLAMNDFSSVSLSLDANKLLVPSPDPDSGQDFREESVLGSVFSSWGDAPDGFSEEMSEVNVAVGGEYAYNDQFFGRAGFFYEDDDKGGRQYATLGAGFKYNITNFNFAYLFSTNDSNNPLDGTLRFSLDFDLN